MNLTADSIQYGSREPLTDGTSPVSTVNLSLFIDRLLHDHTIREFEVILDKKIIGTIATFKEELERQIREGWGIYYNISLAHYTLDSHKRILILD